MDPETKKLLDETLELARENNKLLQKIHGVQKRAIWWSILKAVVVIGIAFGSFYFLEPYVARIESVYSSLSASNLLNINKPR
jgi:hypothetical protein